MLNSNENKIQIDDALAMLQDSSYTKQMEGCKQLGKLRDKQAVPHLVEAARSSDEWVASEAAEALGLLGDSAAIPILLERLTATKEKQQIDKELAKLADYTPPEGSPAQANPGLIALAYARDLRDLSDLRGAAAKALGQIGGPESVAALIPFLGDTHITAVPNTVAAALTMIGTTEALTAVASWKKSQPIKD